METKKLRKFAIGQTSATNKCGPAIVLKKLGVNRTKIQISQHWRCKESSVNQSDKMAGIEYIAGNTKFVEGYRHTGRRCLWLRQSGHCATAQRAHWPGVEYQPQSALLQSVQQQGVLGTVGAGITGAVRNALGSGLIGTLGEPNRDLGNVGVQVFNTGTAMLGAVGSMRGQSIGPNGGARKLYNLYPSDPVMPGRRYKLIQMESGNLKYQLPSGERRTPKGAFDFIQIDGEIWISPVRNNVFSTHLQLSKGSEVDYAGSIQFSQKGALKWWNNSSGHYQPPAAQSPIVNLPTNLFKPIPD